MAAIEKADRLQQAVDGIKGADQKIAGYNIAPMDKQPTEKAKAVMTTFVRATLEKGVQNILREYSILKEEQRNPDCVGHAAFSAHPTKNRYRDIVCNDDTRVVLKWPKNHPNDYIHANWIRGINGLQKDIICTQAPIMSTIEDFWRMVWQEKCAAIIMLCCTVENGKKKCEQYWPLNAGEKMNVCGLQIETTMVQQISNDTIYSKIIMKGIGGDGQPRQHLVNHVLWSGWPDKGVPATTTGAIRLIHRVQQFNPSVVHCSAGVGRTGTIVGIEACIRSLLAGRELSVFNIISDIRKARYLACQTDSQYLYIHMALINYINSKHACTAKETMKFYNEYWPALGPKRALTPPVQEPPKTPTTPPAQELPKTPATPPTAELPKNHAIPPPTAMAMEGFQLCPVGTPQSPAVTPPHIQPLSPLKRQSSDANQSQK